MRNCIIHIGMHKTGTTSIQQSLHRFADNRFFYAVLGNVCNHSLAIYSIFADKPERHHLHKAHKRDETGVARYITEMKSDLERSIETAGDRTLIISGEDIGILSAAALKKLQNYFAQHFDVVSIVAYVRTPAAFISSSFQEKVKGGVTNRFDLTKEYRSFEKSFSKFDSIFGKNNVHLWKFIPETFPHGCVVSDFCQRLQVELPSKKIVRSNESLSRPLVALLFTYGKYAAKFGFDRMAGAESQRLAQILAEEKDDRFRFSPDILRPILENNRKDIQWMESRLGQPLIEKLGSYQKGDVSSEKDLLAADPEIIKRILNQLGDRAPANVNGGSVEEMVLLVHALREKLGHKTVPAKADKVISRNKQVDLSEMVRQIRQNNPDLFADIPSTKAIAFLREAFRYINRNLSTMDEGVEKIPRFGKFRIRKLKSGQESSAGQKVRRQIIFQKTANEAANGSENRPSGSSGTNKANSNAKLKK